MKSEPDKIGKAFIVSAFIAALFFLVIDGKCQTTDISQSPSVQTAQKQLDRGVWVAATATLISGQQVNGGSFTVFDNVASQSQTWEVKITGTAPASTSITISPCMRGGTCGTNTTSTSTTSTILTSTGLFDNFLITVSWTGGNATTAITINRTASVAKSGGAGGGAVASVFGRTGAVTAQNGDYSFDKIVSGNNATTLGITGAGTLSPSNTGQLVGSQDWYQSGPGVISPIPPTLAVNITGGTLATGSVTFTKVTYAGLAVTEPSGEVKISSASCTGGNQCSVTATMPTSCTAGNLPVGVTGCTVWTSSSSGTEKQQTASAACVNITATTCVIGTLGVGSSLVTPQTGITPAGAQTVTCPDNIIPTNWFEASDGNFYNLAGVDVSALNLPSPAGTFTWCHRLFVNDTSGPPVIANALVSIHHQAGNLTNTGTGVDDRAIGIEMIDTNTALPNFEQSLTQYNERIVTNTNFTCAPISHGAPWGEDCASAGRFIANDSRTANVAGATSVTALAGDASSTGATAEATGTGAGYIGVKGGAFQSTNGQNGNSNVWIGGYFGANGASANVGTATGIGVLIAAPGNRFNTQSVGLEIQNHAASINDWDELSLGNGTTGGKSMFQAQVWLPAIVAENSTIAITGSTNTTGGITTSQLSAISSGVALSTFGTAGATTNSYKETCVDVNGNETTGSSAGNIATANADLTAAHGDTVTFNMTSGTAHIGCSSFNIYRTVSGSTCNGGACTNGKIGNVAASFVISSENFNNNPSFNDTGQVGDNNTTVAQPNTTGGVKPFNYQTNTNCAVNSVSPAACGSAAAGAVVVPTTTTTYTVNTTQITANSRIFLMPMSFAGNLPSAPTCVAPAITTEPTVSAIVAGTSFTFALASTTGQTCWQYWIVN